MCGIVGLITKNANGFGITDTEIFTAMVQMDTIRGKDSTGVFGIDKEGQVDIVKADTNGYTFTTCGQYTKFAEQMYSSYRVAIGHNRAATKGSVTAHNAHPFKAENITLVHNGTIYNKDDLDKDVEVDSHAIAIALSKDHAQDALEKINGPFALVWYDSNHKTINLARNRDRPLFLVEYQDHWAIASEAGLPIWLNGRESRKFVKTPLMIPPEKILQFDLTNLSAGPQEIEYSNYAHPIPVFKSTTVSAMPQSNLHLVTSTASSVNRLLSTGANLQFKIEEVKHEAGDKDWIIYGYPLFGDEIDMNILVKTDKGSRLEADHLISTGFAQGTITSIGQIGSMPVYFVRYAVPLYKDGSKNISTESDIKAAIAQGCNRCKGVLDFKEINDSIVRKRKDGTYRTLCKKCLAESIAKAEVPSTEKVIAQ